MFAATTPTPAAPATDAVKASLTERVVATTSGAIDHIVGMDLREVGVSLAISGALIFGGWIFIRLVRRAMDGWLAKVAVGGAGAPDKDAARTQKAARFSWMLLRALVVVLVAVMVLDVWGIDVQAILTGHLGARLVRLALVVVLATALVELAGFVINRLVTGFAQRSGDARRAAQLRTLGPILTGCAQAVLIIVGVLTVLTELGLKVGPILASAGVLGIAVGFGAQTLVKDFLTGLFLIAEDVVSVGDNVEIGGSSGVVEAMTLRTIRLRDANATLHIFPYSEAQVIHNRTKIFSSYVAEIPVSYDTDLDRALSVIQQVGDEMRADPRFGPMITQPFEVMGVDRLADNAIHLKARFVTKPRTQWDVGREFNRRLKNAFDRDGVLTPVKTTPVAAQSLAPQPPRLAEESRTSPES